MTVEDRALVFDCAGERLVGVLSMPDAARTTAVAIIVGGPQYRAGSHRQFLQLAHALADSGYPVLRFDYRGMGDSSGAQRDFESVTPDIAAAIDALQAHAPLVDQVVLFGLCDGASAALLYLDQTADRRVAGLCLLNPWLRSAQSQAQTRLKHYYLRRMLERAFWRKLFSGGVGLARLGEFFGAVRQSRSATPANSALAVPARRSAGPASLPYPLAMARAWRRFGGPLMLALSDNDYTAREFAEYARISAAWQGLLQRPQLLTVTLPDSDHTLSAPAGQALFTRAMINWLDRQTQAR